MQEDWVLCRVFYQNRTTTARPASTDETASLSSELISLPLPHMPPAADAYLAFDHGAAAAIDGYYQQQGDAGLPVPALHHQPALPLDKSLSSFRDLLSSMVQGSDDGGGAIAKAELHRDWTEAAYAQQQQQHGGVPPHGPQAWNPFLSSG